MFKILLNETVGEKERELAEEGRNVRKLKSIICSKILKKETGENEMSDGKGKLEKFSQNAEEKVRYESLR